MKQLHKLKICYFSDQLNVQAIWWGGGRQVALSGNYQAHAENVKVCERDKYARKSPNKHRAPTVRF